MRDPVVLFGAFDRHNLGDLLFAHVAAGLLGERPLRFAGLVERDLCAFGGHRVEPLARIAGELAGRSATLIHVGGEILTCDAWQAAVMVSQPDDARRIVARLDARPWPERLQWAREVLGTRALAPYCASRSRLPGAARIAYVGVGGVDLDACARELRDEVLASLADADAVTVRDRRTLAALGRAGIAARLAPDPVSLVAELFADRIRERAARGDVARLRDDLPDGYLAVQFSADFGDDDTLGRIAAQLDRAAAAAGCGVALFRAGAAPWHDDLDVLRRAASRMRAALVRVFESLDVWDICALIAGSRGYCGSSLHGRIVAIAFALPRVNLRHPACGEHAGKQAAYAASWEARGAPATVDVAGLAAGIGAALAADPQALRDAAATLAGAARAQFGGLTG